MGEFHRRGRSPCSPGLPGKDERPTEESSLNDKAVCAGGSGTRVAVQMHHWRALGGAARVFTIVFGLLLTEGITLGAGSFCRFNAADAAPAHTMLGGERAHLIFRVMNPAAVAEYGFRHHNLSAIGTGQSENNDMPVLPFNDTLFAESFVRRAVACHFLVTERSYFPPKLAEELF